MNNPSSIQKDVFLELPRSLNVGKLERSLYPQIRLLTRKPIHLDLSACQYIDVPALLYLTALIKHRAQKNLPTYLQLPLSQKVLDFFQIWNFPHSVEDATGYRFSYFTRGDNADYFENPPSDCEARYAGIVIRSDKGPERLLSKHYLALTTFRRQFTLFNSSLAITEAARWRHVGLVLRNVLRGPQNLFASRIIYEALINAMRHPAATIIQMGSQILWPSRQSGKGGYFTMTLWDDGLSIIETLRKTLQSKGSVHSSPKIRIKTSYRLTVEEDYGAPTPAKSLSSKRQPHLDDKDDYPAKSRSRSKAIT